MKKLFAAFVRHGPWPLRIRASREPEHASTTLLAVGLAGVLVGLQTAAVFVLTSMVLPVRIALLLSLCLGLAANMPRPAAGLAQPTLSGKSTLALGLLMLIKLETLSEIEHEWSAIILMCSTAWARCASLASRVDAINSLAATPLGARLICLLIGMLPMLFFGIWPEPAWGLWVAGLVALIASRLLPPSGWAAPLIVRWVAAEAIYCISVVLLMSAAALAEFTDSEPEDS